MFEVSPLQKRRINLALVVVSQNSFEVYSSALFEMSSFFLLLLTHFEIIFCR